MDKSASKTVEDLAEALKTARERGQQIIPVVGAGLSADCGFPVIASVVRYFGKLLRYIRLRGPLYNYRETEPNKNHKNKHLNEDIFKRHFDRYEEDLWQFLDDFGWPDRFQLNEDLFIKLKAEQPNAPVRGLIESAVREELDLILPRLNPHGAEEYSNLHKDISEILTKSQDGDSAPNRDLQIAVENVRQKIDSRFQKHWSKSAAFDVIGDWRRLILSSTNYRSDYADALFARFGATRRPGQGHRFLAFLSKILAVRTILTFNFDSLIEEALEAEGIRCKVFAMERGAGLPHQNLVRDQLSVIKAHGSTHALLLDEQLDRPLSPNYLKRFDRITGENPVLLVVGCSADDRRLRDLVSHVLDKAERAKSSNSHKPPSVAWLHYELSAPPFLYEKGGELRRGTVTLPTNNPGATLTHLYSWLMNSNPASRTPYIAHVQQPIELAAVAKRTEKSGESKEDPFELFWVEGSKSLTASQLLLKRANEWARNGYQFIWVDLESLHTFAGVIGSIIDQCRKYDPDLAPSLLPADIDRIGGSQSDDKFLDAVIASAARRVARALRRARYYLAIDGLDSYGWPATTHHGLTHMAITRGAKRRVESMAKFLESLEMQNLGESRVGVSLDILTTRYESLSFSKSNWFERLSEKAKRQSSTTELNPNVDFTDQFSQLRADLPIFSLDKIPDELKRTLSQLDDLGCRASIAMILFSLACFRRTRPLVATTYLLEPLLGKAFDRDTLQRILRLFTEQGDVKERIWILQQLEGGSYWFNHSIRDRIYAENTKYTDSTSIRECLGIGADNTRTHSTADHCRNTVFQLFLGATIHQRISLIWYNLTFVQSRDTFAFLEYTYHRISSVRNLVKLRAFARLGATDPQIAKALVEGIGKCGELIRLINEKNPPFEKAGFGNDALGDMVRKYSENSESPNWCEEVTSTIQECLRSRHHRQLHGLYRGWTRAERILRTQVPTEQLLHWCDELLSDDLIHRCNRLVQDYDELPSTTNQQAFRPVYYNFGSKSAPVCLIDPELEEEGGDLKEFRRFLQDLQVKLWIERSDYDTCIRHRRRHLWHSLSDKTDQLQESNPVLNQIPKTGPIETEIENCDELIEVCEVRQCHQLLNIVNCKLKLQQEMTFDDQGLKAETTDTGNLLQKIKDRLKCIEPSIPKTSHDLWRVQSNDFNEAWLRLLHLETETQTGHVSMFSHDGFTGDLQDWTPLAVNISAVQETTDEGLREIGGRDVHTREGLKSVILHPTPDAALYLQYRSVFYLLKGRTQWLIKTEKKREGLEKALHSFEMAKGGLDSDNPLLSALIEIYLAEAFLGHARAVLFDLDSETGFQEAQEMYDSARGALRRARESLLASPHHLMSRKLFFRMATQYHADRLLLRYAKMQEKRLNLKASKMQAEPNHYWEENAREALLRLRRAYQTLVSALDLYLPPPAKRRKIERINHSNRFRWLYRMWWELTLCGYATGRVVIEAVQGDSISEAEAHDYVMHQLVWINTADGVEDSALGSVIRKNYRYLEKHYQESLKGDEDPNILKQALWRRRMLMHQTNELSKNRKWWYKNF